MKKAMLMLWLVCLSCAAWAQLRVEVTGVGLTQIPIAILSFVGEAATPQKIGAIVQADLQRSGQFRAVDVTGMLSMNEMSVPDASVWRVKGVNALVAGSVQRLADGRFDVRFRLWNMTRGVPQEWGGESYAVAVADLRLASHRVADYVYEKLTGGMGIFSSRIAYVTKTGATFDLWVADADGDNTQSALNSSEPIISPSWSPNGEYLAYVSFEARKPMIFLHNLGSQKRRLVANFKGSNSAPAWSPDGNTLAVTLSRDGGSQLFLLDLANTTQPRRLTQSNSIDTEPVFAPDGKTIYFVSDRGGMPQIYRMPVSGGTPQRVTFSGTYNVSPALSADGKWLAYIARVGATYKLHVMDLASNTAHSITDSVADESPSFSPNSRLIIYATQEEGREVLMTTTLDGIIKTRLAGRSGELREPDWGPIRK